MIMPFVSRRQFTTALGVASAAALATTAAASAAPPDRTGGDELLRRMHVPVGRSTADGPVWSPTPTGFAGVPTEEAPSGAVGGRGVWVLVFRAPSAPAEAVLREGPPVVLVQGTHTTDPRRTTLEVSRDTSILGDGSGAEIVGGGFHLDQLANVVIRNLTCRDS